MYLVFVYKKKICIVFKSRGVEFLKFHLSLFAIYTVGLKKEIYKMHKYIEIQIYTMYNVYYL